MIKAVINQHGDMNFSSFWHFFSPLFFSHLSPPTLCVKISPLKIIQKLREKAIEKEAVPWRVQRYISQSTYRKKRVISPFSSISFAPTIENMVCFSSRISLWSGQLLARKWGQNGIRIGDGICQTQFNIEKKRLSMKWKIQILECKRRRP